MNSHETDLDLGGTGPSVGDRFSVFGDIYQDGERVGAGGYECVTLLFTPGPDPASEPEALTDQCTASLSLADGQITAQGLVDRTGPRCRSRSPSPAGPARTAPPTANSRRLDPARRATSRSPRGSSSKQPSHATKSGAPHPG
jgi:hypothetical protein